MSDTNDQQLLLLPLTSHSLARAVGGVFGTVSRAVAAQEAGGVLRGDGGVLGFDPRPL